MDKKDNKTIINDRFWKWKWFLIPAIVLILPVIINFTLLSWRAGITFGEPEAWLSFFGNYLGALISGIVAVLIALYTINKQSKKNLEKEIELKRIEQLPALVWLEIHIDKYFKSMQDLEYQKSKIKEHNEKEEIEEILNKITFELSTLNERYWSYLDKLTDKNLQAKLIKFGDYYTLLHESMTYDVEENELETIKLSHEKAVSAEGIKMYDIDYMLSKLSIELNIIQNKRAECWEDFNIYIESVKRIDEEIKKELRTIEELQNIN